MRLNFLILFAVFAGVLVALQGTVNARLGAILAHPLQATLVSFSVGVITVILALLVTGAGFPDIVHLRRADWYLYIGGVCGVIFVTVALLLVPKIGVASVVLSMFVGQILASLVIDQMGLLGLPRIPLSTERGIGAALLVAGLYFVNSRSPET